VARTPRETAASPPATVRRIGLTHALTPIQIGAIEVKNRVVRTAHGTNIGQGRVNEELIAYHEARAAGGVGLTILEAASVHWSDAGTLRIHDESAIADYQQLMTKLAPYGMRVFQQLGHLGFGGVTMDGSPPWSASDGPTPLGGPAHAMTTDEIAEVTDAWVKAAVYCREGGLDGVEIHIAHGFLLQEFLSPRTNRRNDEYGGSWDNRMRFTWEVMRGVRSAVGTDFVVGVRTGAEAIEDGLSEHDCAEMVREIEAAGLIDYVNVSYGSVWAGHKIMGGMIEPAGYELPTSEVVTKVSHLPTIVTGRFRTLAEIDEVIDRGVADLVGMTRAHIADPDIVRKTVAGRADEVRPCIAANDGCIGGLHRGRMGCAVNPAAGAELTHVEVRADPPRRIVVVGGGPAGLEAARVAAERGHDVVLVEQAAGLGGAMRTAAEFPHRALLADFVDWQARELDRLGVDVRLGTEATLAVLQALTPDVVVIATGALGGTLPDDTPARSVVIDRHGGYEALAVAELLRDRGSEVALTAAKSIGGRLVFDGILRPTLQRLEDRGVDVRPRGEVVEQGETAVVIEKRSHDPFSGALEAAGIEVHVVGDAHEPAGHLEAIHAGNALGRRL
jgi:2,4-dienoyl-CoA reductase-like NADH-dependent reductase (Old Yellow Enzyme family)